MNDEFSYNNEATENANIFGSEIMREAWTSGRVFAKRIKYFIPALLAAAFGLLMFTGEDYMAYGNESDVILVAGSIVIALLFLLLAFTLVKKAEIIIYENGATYTRGNKTKNIAYSQIAGIYRESGTIGGGFLVGGLVGMLPIFQVYKFIIANHGADKTAALQGAGIPGEYASAISANITKDKRIVLRHRRTPGYNHTTKELELAFTRHMMKDITTETLPETNISFGDQLQLRDGDLVQTTRKWRKTIETVIPFGSIYRMSDSAPITLDGHPNVKGKSETLVNLGDTGHNIEVLRQIIKLGSVPTT